jgi:hypothetical protein
MQSNSSLESPPLVAAPAPVSAQAIVSLLVTVVVAVLIAMIIWPT